MTPFGKGTQRNPQFKFSTHFVQLHIPTREGTNSQTSAAQHEDKLHVFKKSLYEGSKINVLYHLL